MIKLTDEMRDLLDTALADGYSCLVGTSSRDGWPQISPKGSVMVYDDETLAYWERARRSGLANLLENPKVVVYYSNSEKRIRWRFYGEASIEESGAVRDDVMSRTVQAELDRDPERQGVAILIRVDQVGELSGNILQQRD